MIAVVAVALVAAVGAGIWVSGHPASPQAEPAAEDTSDAAAESPLPDAQASLADYSWGDLARIADEISAAQNEEDAKAVAERFNILDSSGSIIDQTKDLELSDGTVVPMRVCGVYADEKADGTARAGLTFIAARASLEHAMGSDDDAWEGSEMRHWLNNDVLAEFPQDLASQVASVNKLTNNVGVTDDPSAVTTTSERVWLPSLVELTGTLSWSRSWKDVLDAEGTQYQWFEEQGTRSFGDNDSLEMEDGGGDSVEWWTRSITPTGYAYRIIDEDGSPVSYATPEEKLGVIFAFCL